MLVSNSAFSQVNIVSSNTPIEASKFNEIINELNSLRTRLDLAESKAVPVGSVVAMAGNCATGYLEANGASLNRSDYASLFSVISTSHGFNSSTTFSLPDYRGRFLRMVDGTANLDIDKNDRTSMASGGASGNNVGSVQDDNYLMHDHIEGYGGAGSSSFGNVTGTSASAQSLASASTTHAKTSPSGGNETRPKNAYVRYCVKVN